MFGKHNDFADQVIGPPLRIANLIEEGKLGGPQVRICAVAAALKGQADTTVIMPLQNSGAFRRRCDALGVSYRVLPITRITKEWSAAVRYVLFSVFEVLRLTREFKKGGFDLVHVSGGSWQFKGVLAAKLAGKKVLWHLNDTSMPGFIRRLFSVISPLADGFIFASERSRAYYDGMVREDQPEFVVPAPVDGRAFDPSGEHLGERELLEHWTGKLVVGTVANISPVKGLDVLIRSAAKLKKLGFDVQFVVIGAIYPSQQRYFSDLQKLAAELLVDNIEFVGAKEDVRALMKRFDIYLCSSNAESSPISVWEAMAMAKPVVSTDVGDVPIYVKDGESGFVVDVGDSGAMAERLARLLENTTKRQAFGEKAREMAVRELDVLRCAERHLAAYQEILSL